MNERADLELERAGAKLVEAERHRLVGCPLDRGRQLEQRDLGAQGREAPEADRG